jgi:hypothetical protein
MAVCLLTFVVVQAPHTVHHIFESETVNDHECAFNNAVERSSATTVEVVQALTTPEIVGAAPVVDPARFRSRTLAPTSARAPPVRVS